MKNLTKQFIIILVALLLLFVTIISLLLYAEYKEREINAVIERMDKLEENFVLLSNLNNIFLLKKIQKNIDNFANQVVRYEQMRDRAITYRYLYFTITVSNPKVLRSVNRYNREISCYIKTSLKLFEKQKILGLNHLDGLYGSFRNDVHKLHKIFHKPQYIQLELKLYKMRRHEKDFMLRGLMRYVEGYQEEYESLQKKIQSSSIEKKSSIRKLLDLYHKKFMDLVMLSEEIGYTNASEGILQELSHDSVNFNRCSTHTKEEILLLKESVVANNTYYYSILSILFLLLAAQFYLAKMNIDKANDSNPLTGLNGNRRINDYMKYIAAKKSERLIVYFDFDHFKPFNDRFGFKIGDDAIFIFSEILKKYFAKQKHFIGHIGGDDFIVIIDHANFDKTMQRIYSTIEDFENYAKTFYTQEEQSAKRAILKDRFGVSRELPLMSVSAAVIQITTKTIVKNYEDISQIISSTKKCSKITQVAISTLLESES